jgi:hypothetical protein
MGMRVQGGGGNSGRGGKEAQHEWAGSGGQSTSLSAATPRGLLACPVSQRAQGGPGSVELLSVAERDMRLPHRGGAEGVSSAIDRGGGGERVGGTCV